MRLVAVAVDSMDLPVVVRERLEGTNLAVFELERGREYTALAMFLSPTGLKVMVFAGWSARPSFVPVEAFAVSEPSLNPNWGFVENSRDVSSDVRAIWGYRAMIADKYHFDGVNAAPSLSAWTAFIEQVDRDELLDHERASLKRLEAQLASRRAAPPT